jgi:hypothetical protein
MRWGISPLVVAIREARDTVLINKRSRRKTAKPSWDDAIG